MTLAHLTDRQLLKLRVCDLPGLSGEGDATASLRRYIAGLHRELAAAGCKHLRPDVYLGDEWFSPDGVPSIAVPFYLTHPRLRELEKTMMREVEGGTPRTLRQLLRHEAGHAFDHAYGVSKTKEWRQVFGAPPRRYDPDVYVPDSASRDFVQHLPGFYAQAHPEEDFAETFAVLITPGLDWRRQYRNWPGALAKLEFTAALIRRLGKTAPRVANGPRCYVASRMRRTLASYYATRRRAASAHAARVKNLTRAVH